MAAPVSRSARIMSAVLVAGEVAAGGEPGFAAEGGDERAGGLVADVACDSDD
jgi:hypothetical protein